MRALLNRVKIPAIRFSNSTRRETFERIVPMRKFLGKFGGEKTVGPLLLAATLFLLLSPAFCHAQGNDCWSGFQQPALTSISPTTWVAGQTTIVTMTGLLTCDTAIWVVVPTGLVEIDLLTAPYNVTTWQIAVTPEASDPTETGVLMMYPEEESCFSSECPQLVTATVQIIACSAPTIASVTPNGWWAGQKQDITINGACFLTPSDTKGPSKTTLTDGAGAVKLSNISVVSSTQITATVNVAKDAPAETVTLTVTNPSGSGTPGSVTASPAPVVLPVPVIQWKGKAIRGDGAKKQSVIVGQPVELTTTPASLPGGFTVSNPTWDIDGTAIKQYDGNDSGITLQETDLNTQNTTFYWLYPDDPLNVTYEYCATDPNNNQMCTSPQAKVTFKATRPNIGLTVTNPYDRAKVNELPVCGQKKQKMAHMFYGDLHYDSSPCKAVYAGRVGIELTPSGGDGGTYSFVQVIPRDTISWAGTKPFQCGPYLNVLDGSFPFQGVHPLPPAAPTMAYDGPGQILPNFYSSGTRDFHAVMHLLWQPPQLKGTSTASIPVPIGHQEWQFVANADQTAQVGSGKWQQPTTTAAGKVGDFVPSTKTDNAKYGYPIWGKLSNIQDCDSINQTQEIEE
jgi:hypothetical protein